MLSKSMIVIDGFYDDPFAIRELALQQRFFSKANAGYPGKEALAPGRTWIDEWTKMRSHIGEPVTATCSKKPSFLQGKFRLALASDAVDRPDGVHQDVQRWSGIVYLSLPGDCQGGVALIPAQRDGGESRLERLEKKVFGHLSGKTREEVHDYIRAYSRDLGNWEQIGLIPMAFNRCTLLMAHCFHSSAGIFGDKSERGRLTQHFEFYLE